MSEPVAIIAKQAGTYLAKKFSSKVIERWTLYRAERFYHGFIDILKKKLNRINIGGSGHYYFTCVELHDRNNKNWKLFVFQKLPQLILIGSLLMIIVSLWWQLIC